LTMATGLLTDLGPMLSILFAVAVLSAVVGVVLRFMPR
jgi:hypothetical protein